MTPEQLKGTHEVDERTDIWSLGVVLYQLVSGKLPFEATSATALAALIASEAPTQLGAICPGLPGAYLALVDRCLRKDRAERFANVVELARALAPLAPGAMGSAEGVSRVSRAATARRLSLAATDPELENDDASRADRPRSISPDRVTAALSGGGEDSHDHRTDYGSEGRTEGIDCAGGRRLLHLPSDARRPAFRHARCVPGALNEHPDPRFGYPRGRSTRRERRSVMQARSQGCAHDRDR